MQEKQRHGISFLREQRKEVNIEREARLIILDRHREIGIAVDPVLGLTPIVLRLPVRLGLSQPVARDAKRSEVLDVCDGVFVGLWADLGELEKLLEVG